MKFSSKAMGSLGHSRALAFVVVAIILGTAAPASAVLVTVWEDQFTSDSVWDFYPAPDGLSIVSQAVPGNVVGAEDGFEGKFTNTAGGHRYAIRTIPAGLVQAGDRVEYSIRTEYPTNFAGDRVNLVAPVGGTDFDSGFQAHDSTGALTYLKEPGTYFDLFDTTLMSGLRPAQNLWFGNSGWGGPGVDSIFYVDYIRIVGDRVPVNADFNGNGVVDGADYVLWRKHAGTMGTGTQPTGDANGDTNVDSVDYDLWRGRFGQAAGSGIGSGGAVPEPGTWCLALVASMLLTGQRLRRPSSARRAVTCGSTPPSSWRRT